MNYINKNYKGWVIVEDITTTMYKKFKCSCSHCSTERDVFLNHLTDKCTLPCSNCGMNRKKRTNYNRTSLLKDHPLKIRFKKVSENKESCWKKFKDFLSWITPHIPEGCSNFEIRRKDTNVPHSPENSYIYTPQTFNFNNTTMYELSIKDVGFDGMYQMFNCTCKCGKEYKMTGIKISNLKKSPCLCNKPPLKKSSPVYSIWKGMLYRCNNVNDMNYGGRGVSVCEEWKNDFWLFHNWCISNGYEKVLEIDRIDVNGNYTPDNCRFVTPKQNTRNKRTTQLNDELVSEIRNGKYKDLTSVAISKELKIPSKTIRDVQQYKTWV